MKIGTHDGSFHCDEALACFMLKLLPEYKNAEIVRTRNMADLDTCDIVVDVGAVYDLDKKRFDHHQITFQETMHSLRSDFPWEIRLSSAGLIYFHYGEKIISSLIGRPEDDDDTQIVYRKVYEGFVMEIDAIDNGVNMSDGDTRYTINTNLSARVGFLNPKWNEDQSSQRFNQQFQLAMQLVGNEFKDFVHYYSKVWYPARKLVRDAILKRNEVHDSGHIVEFTENCPWKSHLFDIEEELGIQGEVKYAIFKDLNNSFRVQCVPLKLGSFDNRHSLPWKGLRGDDLSRESGIPECIFVHATGFIGGNSTRAGALEMAKIALETKSN